MILAQVSKPGRSGMTITVSPLASAHPVQGVKARSTVHSIQLLRAIAAMLVVLFHGQQAFSKHIAQATSPIESYLFGFGAVGVHIFFVISGFIMVFTSRFPRGF